MNSLFCETSVYQVTRPTGIPQFNVVMLQSRLKPYKIYRFGMIFIHTTFVKQNTLLQSYASSLYVGVWLFKLDLLNDFT